MPYRHKFKATNSVIAIIILTFAVLMIFLKYMDLQNSLAIGDFATKQLERQDKREEELIRENENLRQQLDTKVQVDEKIKSSSEVKARVLQAAVEKFGYEHTDAMEKLINKESGFNLFALNKSSGACGIFQALPCSKLPGIDLDSQIKWGINYIAQRYGDPSQAWNFHLVKNWY